MEEYYSNQKETNRDDDELLTELDMAAAQQLMQLSDDENHSNKENIIDDDEEEVDQRLMKIINYGVPNLISSRSRLRTACEKIEEIFGKEEEEEEKGEEIICDRPRKKQKCRSLASIYRRTKPIDDDDYKTSIHEKKTVKKSS